MLKLATDEFWGDLIREADRRLAPHGIDLFSVFKECLDTTPELYERHVMRLAEILPQSYIRVGEDTTREQLLRDFRSIKNQQEARVKAGRPPRDPLLALQVAILVKNDWTEAQLAERYGWALGEDDYGKPRCDTARYFARLGREQLVRARSNIE